MTHPRMLRKWLAHLPDLIVNETLEGFQSLFVEVILATLDEHVQRQG